MKKQNILTLILFSLFLSANAQLKLYDSYNNNPISNVKIFSKDGRILALSNLKGEINISKVEFPKKDSIEIYHSNYFSQKMIWTDLIKKPEIHLIPDPIIKLDEVALTSKKPKYLLLKGYFISYQIIDNITLTFSDGIIEYYIDLTKEKVMDTKIVESRTFKNKDSIKALSKRKGNSAINVISTIPPFDFEEEVLLTEWDNYKIGQDGNIKRKNDVIGRINNYSDNSEFTIEYYSPQNTKKISLLGITSIIKNKTISEKFNSKTPRIKKITSLGKYYNSNITKKGVTINYELIQDFHTIESKYLSKENFKDHLNKMAKKEHLHLFLGNKTVSVIPEFIELMLYKDLKLIPNTK